MARFIGCADRHQIALLPVDLEDYVSDENPVRVVDAFVDKLDLTTLGFEGVAPAATGRPDYHPATSLKLYLYGYLNQVASGRRLEREAGRNTEVMWLVCRPAPDFEPIADFRRNNGPAIQAACAQFVVLCRHLGLLAGGVVALGGNRLKGSETRDKNFTTGAIRRRIEQVETGVARYLAALDMADRQEDEVAQVRTVRITEPLAALALGVFFFPSPRRTPS